MHSYKKPAGARPDLRALERFARPPTVRRVGDDGADALPLAVAPRADAPLLFNSLFNLFLYAHGIKR